MNPRRMIKHLVVWLMALSCLAMGDIRVGSRNTYVNENERAAIPVFLIITQNTDVNEVHFDLSGLSSKLELEAVVLNKFLTETWSIDVENQGGTEPTVHLTGTDDPLYSEWTTLCSLIVKPNDMGQDTARLSIGNVRVDESITDTVQGIDFKFWLSNKPNPADFEADGILNEDDVTAFFSEMRNLSDDVILPMKYEFDQFYPVNLQDVALMYAHVIGLYPDLKEPNATSQERPIEEDRAEFEISRSETAAEDTYIYTISGHGIRNFMSAEIFLELNNDVVDKINVSAVTSMTQISGEKYGGSEYRIQYIAGLGTQEDSADVLRITIRHKAGQTDDAIKAVHVSQINGGSIVTQNRVMGCTDPNYKEYDPRANEDDESCETEKGSVVTIFKTIFDRPFEFSNGVMSLPEGNTVGFQIIITDISGKIKYNQFLEPKTIQWTFPSALRPGVYLISILSNKGQWRFKYFQSPSDFQ